MCLLALSPFLLNGQGIPQPVSFSVTNDLSSVTAGEKTDIILDAEIEGDWHLYSITIPENGPVPTSFSVTSDNAFLHGDVSESEADINYDPNFDMDLGWHSKSARFTIPVVLNVNETGEYVVDIGARYMVCNDNMCLPPRTVPVTVPVTVTEVSDNPIQVSQNTGTAESEKESEGAQETSIQQEDDDILSEGVGGFIWLALTAGLAALLTPCVFPMIPLTVSFFSKQGDGSRSTSVKNALIYGLAIVGTFTLLGVLLSLILGASGVNKFASNPWVNLSIGVIFIIFAVSLLGAFELRLPYQLTNYLNRQSNDKSGLAGIIFMGLTISAVSFSCTAPFVGAILAATTKGAWFYPIIGMMVFSGAFAIPFILFSMFPQWLESLPKSGSWMNTIKVVLGFVELAAAYKFISNADLVWSWGLITRPFAIASWIVFSLLAGIYILGKLRLKHEQKVETVTTTRLLFSMPFFIFSIYLLPGLMGASLGIWDAWLPPKQATDVSVVNAIPRSGGGTDYDETAWYDSYEEALEVAKETGKPIFIDFTGYTCTNCRAMESNVFPLDDVQELFDNYVLVKLYTDDGVHGQKHQLFQFDLTGTVALPTYVVIDSETENLEHKISGYIPKEKFVDFLSRGLSN